MKVHQRCRERKRWQYVCVCVCVCDLQHTVVDTMAIQAHQHTHRLLCLIQLLRRQPTRIKAGWLGVKLQVPSLQDLLCSSISGARRDHGSVLCNVHWLLSMHTIYTYKVQGVYYLSMGSISTPGNDHNKQGCYANHPIITQFSFYRYLPISCMNLFRVSTLCEGPTLVCTARSFMTRKSLLISSVRPVM